MRFHEMMYIPYICCRVKGGGDLRIRYIRLEMCRTVFSRETERAQAYACPETSSPNGGYSPTGTVCATVLSCPSLGFGGAYPGRVSCGAWDGYGALGQAIDCNIPSQRSFRKWMYEWGLLYFRRARLSLYFFA